MYLTEPPPIKQATHADWYAKLIEAFIIVSRQAGEYLDLMNFNRDLYQEVIDPRAVEEIFRPAHGYACPDASFELGKLIKNLEWRRDQEYRRWLRRHAPEQAAQLLGRPLDYDHLSTGAGNGTTGVMTCLIKSIFDLMSKGRLGERAPSVVLCTPNYSVYDAIVRGHGGQSVYLMCKEEREFLPDPDALEEIVREDTVAFVLTYPNNPAQTTFDLDTLPTLLKIIRFCRSRGIFLVVDNVYQDLIWDTKKANPEILSLVDSPEYIVKLYGPSKDRPFFSGRRMGYYIGDPVLSSSFYYFSSIFNNTHNSHTSCMFALDMLFRDRKLDGTAPSLDDCRLLDTFLAGWHIRADPAALYENIRERRLFETYCLGVNHNEAQMKRAMTTLTRCLHTLPMVARVVNGNIGNVILVRVKPEVFGGSSDEFFRTALDEIKLGVLPADVFGLPDQPGEAWFRITTIHEHEDLIVERLCALSDHFMARSRRGSATPSPAP